MAKRHTLISKDIPNLRGVCISCGDVPISHIGQRYGKPYYCCSIAKREYSIKAKWGISPEMYQAMYDAQRGLCAICRHDLGPLYNNKRLHIDHDHKTLVNRELLCQRCNMVLGAVNDNRAILRSMINYLEKHSAKDST